MYSNDNSSSRYFGDSLQLTDWILDSGTTCHMTPQVSGFIPGALVDTDKYIKFYYVYHVTMNKKVQVQIKMCDYNINPFFAT